MITKHYLVFVYRIAYRLNNVDLLALLLNKWFYTTFFFISDILLSGAYRVKCFHDTRCHISIRVIETLKLNKEMQAKFVDSHMDVNFNVECN